MQDAQKIPTVGELIPVARSMTVEAFKSLLGGSLLVGPPPSSSGKSTWTFRTDSRRTIAEPNSCMVLMDTDMVIALRKAAGRPFADTLLVGRAVNNDVYLDHPSISKLHARVRFNAAGDTFLSDAESSNGTLVGDRMLSVGESVQLKHGDMVSFGRCRFQFLEAHMLHAMLLMLKG